MQLNPLQQGQRDVLEHNTRRLMPTFVIVLSVPHRGRRGLVGVALRAPRIRYSRRGGARNRARLNSRGAAVGSAISTAGGPATRPRSADGSTSRKRGPALMRPTCSHSPRLLPLLRGARRVQVCKSET